MVEISSQVSETTDVEREIHRLKTFLFRLSYPELVV